MYARLAGLSMDRLIVHRHVYANQIFLPMEGGCQDPVYNTWLVLHMRNYFMESLGLPSKTMRLPNPSRHIQGISMPVMLLMKRSSNSKHTRNGHDLVRQWSDTFTSDLLKALQSKFPRYHVILVSDKNATVMGCHECQIREFNKADVLVAMHGAGLGNMLYMKPTGAIVELCPYGNDGRCLLGGGPFSRLAAVMSHNYMIHHPAYEEFKWIKKDVSSEFNISRFVNHISSFLESIHFL